MAGRASIKFEEIQDLDNLLPGDLKHLLDAMAPLYTGEGLTSLFAAHFAGKIRIYRFIGGLPYGIIILRKVLHRKGAEMEVYCMAGSNVLPVLDELVDFVREKARESDCRWISTQALHPTLMKLYTKKFGDPISVKFLEELK